MKELMIWGAAGALLMGASACDTPPAGETKAAETPATAATPGPAASADESAATAFIAQVFDPYTVDEGTPDTLSNPGKTFEPELAAALDTLGERSASTGELSDAFDADPVCQCQDFGKVSYSIDTLKVDGDRAEAVVTFTNLGTTEKRRVDLVRTPAGWRVYDLDGTFRDAVLKAV